jgi:tRNA uridine 5-carboxymethylaminomethyl modification enzyme
MFTSRAEYRLQLREDNADLRLTETGYKLGLVDEQRMAAFELKRNNVEREKARLEKTWIRPETADPEKVQRILGQPLQREASLLELLRRPEVDYQSLVELADLDSPLQDKQTIRQIEIQVRYSGYIERQVAEIERLRRSDHVSIPDTIDYQNVRGLSSEVTQKLTEIRPENIGQASRIPGITPAAISLLLIYIRKIQRAA